MTQPERFHQLPIETEVRDTEFARMWKRLTDYGLCYLRAGSSGIEPSTIIKIKREGEPDEYQRVAYRDPDPDRKPRQWSRAEIDAAARLHSRVIRLPRVAHRIVLQVFFAETVAAYWSELDPEAKLPMLRDLTNWHANPPGVNARIKMYNRECAAQEAAIHWSDFEPILHRGIRILCNNERMLP